MSSVVLSAETAVGGAVVLGGSGVDGTSNSGSGGDEHATLGALGATHLFPEEMDDAYAYKNTRSQARLG